MSYQIQGFLFRGNIETASHTRSKGTGPERQRTWGYCDRSRQAYRAGEFKETVPEVYVAVTLYIAVTLSVEPWSIPEFLDRC